MTVQASDFGRVAVLMGGWAAEREISLISGKAVFAGLQRKGVDVTAVDVGRDIVDVLNKGEFSRVFNVVHGRGGEDGVLQGVLETLQIPYTGCGVMSSALSMDKSRTKRMWQSYGLPTPAFVMLYSKDDLGSAMELGFPLMIKPIHEGSSLGMQRADNPAELHAAWMNASQYDKAVMAERWVTGAEYTVGILADQALPLIKLETDNQFYDFDAKYNSDDTRYLVPCGLDAAHEKELQVLAMQAFDALGGEGWGRVDLMLDTEGYPWLIELNTVPGMTSHSLVPKAANAQGIEFDDLVWKILEQTLEA